MAQTIETEVVDVEEAVRSEVEKRAPSDKAGSDGAESGSKAPSRKLARGILLLVAVLAVAGVSILVAPLAKLRSHRRRADRRASGLGQLSNQRNSYRYQSTSRKQPIRGSGNSAHAT